MKPRRPLLVGLLTCWTVTASAHVLGDDLGAAARKEAERRRAAKEQAKRSYGDSDLKKPEPTPEPGAAAPASTAAAAPPTAPAPQKAPPPRPPRDERTRREERTGTLGDDSPPVQTPEVAQAAEVATSVEPTPAEPDTKSQEEISWRGRAAAVRQQVEAANSALGGYEVQVDAIRGRLNPMNTNYAYDTNEQLQLQAELTRLQASEPELKRAVAQAEAAQSEFEEQARRSGVPRRWLEPEASE